MKSSTLLAVILIILGMTSCSAEGTDPMENTNESSISLLTNYDARSITSDDAFTRKLHLDELPAITLDEANKILSTIKKHQQLKKEYSKEESTDNHISHVSVTINETVNNQYTFNIQLHMEKDLDSGVTYFKNYQANCSADTFVWYIKGFSFASDNQTGAYKFECPSFLYFKIINDGIQYVQVPISVNGIYHPDTNEADFDYKL